jgi:recombination protein RecT
MAEQQEQGAQLTFVLAMRRELEAGGDQIKNALPDHIDVKRFILVTLTAISREPKLQACGIRSVYLAALELAHIGLFPDGKEAAIIPYRGVAEPQPMWQGIARLMRRSPGVLDVQAHAVFEGDEFLPQYGAQPNLIHVPKFSSQHVTHAYAIIWMQGVPHPTFEVAPREWIEKVRLSSRSPDSSAWSVWYSSTCRKVPLKRLGLYMDLSPIASRAIALDNLAIGNAESWADASIEDISPEYRNALVRASTQARLADLRQRLAPGEEPQEHPPLEQEVTQVPAEEIVPAAGELESGEDPKAPTTSPISGTEANPSSKTLDKVIDVDFWRWVNEKGVEKVADALHINAGDAKEMRALMGKWVKTEMRGIWGDALLFLQQLELDEKP